MTNAIMALLLVPFMALENYLITFVFYINVILLAFNLLPVFPMDGGRIARSLMTGLLGDYCKSTKLVKNMSLIVACVVAPFLWIYFSPIAAILVLFMAFVFGQAEWKHIQYEREGFE